MTLKETRAKIEGLLKELELKQKGVQSHMTVSSMFLFDRFDYVTIITLHALYVEDSGMGIGTDFMKELKNIADSFESIIALSATSTRSLKFYQKLGFKKNKTLTSIIHEELFYCNRRR
jgi:N-acetylglutamate synthase-like GNAT family acetyltransferase